MLIFLLFRMAQQLYLLQETVSLFTSLKLELIISLLESLPNRPPTQKKFKNIYGRTDGRTDMLRCSQGQLHL